MIVKISQETQPSPEPSPEVNFVPREGIPHKASPVEQQRNLQQDIDENVQALLEDPELNMMYADAKHIRDQINTTQVNEQNIKYVQNYLREYLNAFLVIGYDSLGRRILIQHTPKQHYADSLQKYVEQVANTNMVLINASSATRRTDDDDDD